MAGNRRLGIDWERVPWTLWAYVAISVAKLAVSLARLHGYRPAVIAVIVLLVVDYFLLRGVWWLWVATAALLALGLVIDIATGRGSWWGDVIAIVDLVLLLLPPTRAFFADRRG